MFIIGLIDHWWWARNLLRCRHRGFSLLQVCDTTLRMSWGSLTRLLCQLSDVLITLLDLQMIAFLARAGRGTRAGRIEQIMCSIDR
jgi:hypothetical protein